MPLPQPIHCKPEAYELFAESIQRLDRPHRLVRAASAIAMHAMPDARCDDVEAALQAYADRVRDRVRSRDPRVLVTHLHDVLFEEEGFRGNTDDYYDPANSYIPAVLQRKVGIPISLCLIYVNVAQRLDLHAHGINAPGHFLAAIHDSELGEDDDVSCLVVDAFDGGRVLNPLELRNRMERMAGPAAQTVDALPLCRPRQWLARMLQNLLGIFERRGDAHDLSAMLELRMLL